MIISGWMVREEHSCDCGLLQDVYCLSSVFLQSQDRSSIIRPKRDTLCREPNRKASASIGVASHFASTAFLSIRCSLPQFGDMIGHDVVRCWQWTHLSLTATVLMKAAMSVRDVELFVSIL